jgi:UDP-2,3-diacylglucosamine pyrophosphatase LpxH
LSNPYKTMIVSDVHLGSPINRSGDLRKAIKAEDPDQLIINGDLFSDNNFARLSSEDFGLLTDLRKRAAKRTVVIVEGNHDRLMANAIEVILGIPIYPEYWWSWQGLDCLAIHGHQFDKLTYRHRFVTELVSFLYLEAQKVPFIRDRVAQWAEDTCAKWQRLSDTVREKALAYAKEEDIDMVFCGHTHVSYTDIFQNYFNSGCWVGNRATYIIMTDIIHVKSLTNWQNDGSLIKE